MSPDDLAADIADSMLATNLTVTLKYIRRTGMTVVQWRHQGNLMESAPLDGRLTMGEALLWLGATFKLEGK